MTQNQEKWGATRGISSQTAATSTQRSGPLQPYHSAEMVRVSCKTKADHIDIDDGLQAQGGRPTG